MKKFLTSIYAKIAGIFLFLLLLLGAAQLAVFSGFSTKFMKESDQKLNLNLASNLAVKFKPWLKDSIHVKAIKHSFHEMMVMNPRVEFYLLNEKGEILAYFAEPGKVKLRSVSVEPIKTFLSSQAPQLPLFGDDPRGEGRKKPFSVAPVTIGSSNNGYLYVILGGEQYDSAVSMLANSYILKSAVTALLLNIGLTALVGLLLFFLLTRRLRIVTKAVHNFESGHTDTRISIRSADEIGQLASAFNAMADTIQQNMEEIRNNDRLRRELVANISHDLRSPLASVRGYLETILLKRDTLNQKQQWEFLETIYKNLNRLNKLVLELFELSKLDAGQVELQWEPFSIAELCQDVILKFKPLAEKKGISVHQQFPEKLSMANGDIGMIERAISNLLDNALNYTHSGGTITVVLEEREQDIAVRISDNGMGISSKDMPHIFDRFYRVDKSRSSGSTGLGLAITKKIIEAHHCDIQVKSTLNQGTTFEFTLEKVEA